jgi:hypothetical protein
MFDGLTGMDWMFITAALAFGFGVVKFMFVAKAGSKAAVPSAMPDVKAQSGKEASPAEENVVRDKQFSADGRWELSRIDESPLEQPSDHSGEKSPRGAAWFELLDVPRTASAKEIEQAFERKWTQFSPGRLTSLLADLNFIANGGLEPSMPKMLEVESMRAASLAAELKSMLSKFLHDIEGAHEEGLFRRRQGYMD